MTLALTIADSARLDVNLSHSNKILATLIFLPSFSLKKVDFNILFVYYVSMVRK
jgi:hypothetical protein